ncbi:Uncharacterised protein [Chromobacterium violaceum]|uniref:Restriction endonuclease type IV Mrr domain-containing protein n=1 Tax=Chromobacterium violaceum TaxID=536 RepID=A0A3S4JV17_CHRVL|nr:Uncharacterised protein [Chromobacterium violaceum]
MNAPIATDVNSILNFIREMDSMGTDPGIVLYDGLFKINKERLKLYNKMLDVVENAKYKKEISRKSKKDFEAQKSRLKGKLLEIITKMLLDSCKCFGTKKNVHTSTNEIDILVSLNPLSLVVPALRRWGTHCIAECKFHDSYVTIGWVSKLHTVMTTHGASVGMLFSKKGIATTGRGVNIRHALQMLSLSNAYIIPFDRRDIVNVINGKNFLCALHDNYVETQIGSKLQC